MLTFQRNSSRGSVDIEIDLDTVLAQLKVSQREVEELKEQLESAQEQVRVERKRTSDAEAKLSLRELVELRRESSTGAAGTAAEGGQPGEARMPGAQGSKTSVSFTGGGGGGAFYLPEKGDASLKSEWQGGFIGLINPLFMSSTGKKLISTRSRSGSPTRVEEHDADDGGLPSSSFSANSPHSSPVLS